MYINTEISKNDMSNADTTRLLQRLANYLSVEAMPGSVRVLGYDAFLERHERKNKNWNFSGNSVTLQDITRFMSCQDGAFTKIKTDYDHDFLGGETALD